MSQVSNMRVGGCQLRSAWRVVLTIVFGIISCGLSLFGLIVARSVWLLLGRLYLPNHYVFNFLDKVLVLIAGIAALVVIIYNLESLADTEKIARLWQKFLRVSAYQIWFLGICHTILGVTEAGIGFADSSTWVLPAGELLVGTALYFLHRRQIRINLTDTQMAETHL